MSTVEDMLPGASMLAQRALRRYNVPYEEAYSDALYGLAYAQNRCTNNDTFRNYAWTCMWGAILKGVRKRSPFRVDSKYLRETLHGVQPVHVPLVEKFDDGVEREVLSDPSSPDPVAEAEKDALWELVDHTLSDRDSFIMRARFKEDLSQRQIALRLGISQMHVSRIISKSCSKLKEEMVA